MATQLYNMDLKVQEWRKGKFQRGDTWRSRAIYQCEICHTQSNRWIMGGWPGMGPRIVCEGTQYQEHEELEQTLEEYASLDRKIKTYQETAQQIHIPNAETPIQSLSTESQLLKARANTFRELFKGKLDDLIGLENAEVILYHPSSRYVKRDKTLKKP